MSVKVTITVEVDNVSAGAYTVTDSEEVMGDNPLFTALSVKNGIAHAGERIIKMITARDGDVRDHNEQVANAARVVTAMPR